jgi:hypothetical protein
MTDYYTRIHKISPLGNVLWSKLIASDHTIQKKAVSVEPSGAFIAQITGTQIIAFNAAGDELWSIDDSDGVERIKSMVIGSDGYVYLSYNTDLVPEIIGGEFKWTTYYKTLKINSSGTIVWTYTSSKNIF